MTESPYLRGDVWRVDFGSDPEHLEHPEQASCRPAVFVSDDRLHHPALRMITVVPGTSRIRSLSIHVEVEADAGNGLDSMSAFQAEQIRSLSSVRLVERIGRLDAISRHSLDDVLRLTLRLT